jgi:hypothetical protein
VTITSEHVAYKKKIGYLGARPVIEVATTGGLILVVVPTADGVDTLGAGPHRAVARHIAKKRKPDLRITELTKADWMDSSCFEHLLPQWEAETARIRSLA